MADDSLDLRYKQDEQPNQLPFDEIRDVQCVYKLLIPNCSKFYIGSTVNIKVRIRRHRSCLLRNQHSNKHLQNCFNKYGKTFKVEILEEVENKAELDKREQFYIDLYGFDNLLNQCPMAYSTRDRKASIKTREKIRQNSKRQVKEEFTKYWKGKTRSISQRINQSIRQKGRKLSEETKAKLSEKNKKWKRSQEHLDALHNAWRGSKHTEETKAKLSEIHRGRVFSEETKQKMRDNHRLSKKVAQIDIDTLEVINIYPSASEAARCIGKKRSSIGNCCCGISKTAFGFIWKYIED